MHPKVEEFLQKAKEDELKKRQDQLIKLGLYEEIEVSNGNYNRLGYITDKDTGQYVYKYYKWVAIDISDEEYEMILKYYPPNEQEQPCNNGAEKFLETINTLTLIIGIVIAMALALYGFIAGSSMSILYGIGGALITTIYWAVIKVTLNISNNLHQINAKLK